MSGKRIINSVIILVATCAAVFGLWFASNKSSEIKFSSPFSFIQSKPQLSILVVGDIMLDRNVRNKINEIGFDKFFDSVRSFLAKPDLAVGNLEGPFTDFPSVTTNLKNKELKFTFDPANAKKLGKLGFDILGLANNHTYNFGKEGFAQTKKYLQDADISYYGDPDNKDGLSVILQRNDLNIGFVGFNEFSYKNFDKVLSEIDRVRPQVDVLIVSPHWGIEYQKEPTDFMKKWAHAFIDHGANVVIGTHPHVVGDVEDYKNRKIFYSLGNFTFDQYFSKETSEGLAVNIDVEKSGGIINLNYTLTRVLIDQQGVTVSD